MSASIQYEGTAQASSKPAGNYINLLLAVGGIGTLVSLGYVFSELFTTGHTTFNSGSNVAWGLPVAVYVHLALASSGLTIIAALGMVFGVQQFQAVAKRCIWLGLITLIGAFSTLAMELGHPFRMLWALPFSFQFQSMMWWMGALYAADLVFMAWKFQKMSSGDWTSKSSKQLGVASLIAVILASTMLGMVFGVMGMRPLWYGGFVPFFFIVSGVMTGAALLMFFVHISYGFKFENMPAELKKVMTNGLPTVFALTLAAVFLMTATRTVAGMWSNVEGFEVFWVFAASPMYHFNLWLGLLVPFILMVLPQYRANPMAQVYCGVAVLIGMLASRYYFIVGGQLVPLFKGQSIPGYVQYAPSMAEWMLLVYGMAMVGLFYALGEKYLRLDAAPLGDK